MEVYPTIAEAGLTALAGYVASPEVPSSLSVSREAETLQPQAQQSATAVAAAAPTPAEQLQALEAKMAKWKEAVATQLNDAARKNKKLREELRLLREEKEGALSDLRVQLAEEFQERTAMQRDELAALKQQAAALREEKKTMAATHEAELQTARAKLREVIQLELETEYKRREEQWVKEKVQLQTRTAAKETERAQAEHECDMLKLRLGRLGTQYDELAALLQPDGGATSPTRVAEVDNDAAIGATSKNAASTSADAFDTNGSSAARQQTAVAAAHAKQMESIKAELQSKEQRTQFLLDRAKQEYEAEKAQLLRELQLREEELKVAHTLLKQVQVENSQYMERVSHAQTEQQALEQRYAAKVSAFSQELAERINAADKAQVVNKRLQEQLRASQQQVATLEEESTMREEAFHSLMFSEDSKRITMELQRAVQAARDEAEEWKMQYYASVTASSCPSAAAATSPADPSQQKRTKTDDAHVSAVVGAPAAAAAVRTPQAWHDQLAAREADLNSQAAQLARKAALLEAAEAKLNKMRSSMASQASILLQQSRSGSRGGGSSGVAGPHGRREDGDSVVFAGGGHRDNAEDDDNDRSLADTSPLISTAVSLLPSALHGSLRLLEAQRRRLHLPGTCGLCACCFSGAGTTGAPRRLRFNALLITVMAVMMLVMLASFRAVV
ncbi:hypothetical protein LSCM1_06548 [Leishmania martiniquensis]|uniref:Transmembrane protein n=1 Tax=Leishmania martiniquensis TaxID=1580590 RepID=A0A836HEJ9_9TRYP|nr:hypothetical protein LSCM1_06548 [Leishmania martiniquensis]